MTLTEQWKKGELQNDWYYIRTTNGIEKWEYIKQSHGFGYYETEWVLEVLAPVPSYEEWQYLKEQSVKNTDAYYDMIIAARNGEIEDLKKEIKQLKELLKECLDEIHEFAEIQDDRSVTIYNFLSAELVSKIDEVLK